MKKIFLWIVAFTIVLGFVVFQWVGADSEKKRLEAGIGQLEHDLQTIADARSKLPDIAKSISEEKAAIEELHKRLPREPMVESFMDHLSEQLKEAGVEISTYTSTLLKREFYDENHLEIIIKQELREPKTLKELIRKSERLVTWKGYVSGPPSVLHLSIYSISYTLKKPSIKPCAYENDITIGWWPFNSSVKERQLKLQQLCAERQNEDAILLEVRRYRDIRTHRLRLETVISSISS